MLLTVHYQVMEHVGSLESNQKATLLSLSLSLSVKGRTDTTENRLNGKNTLMMNGYRTVHKPFERFG